MMLPGGRLVRAWVAVSLLAILLPLLTFAGRFAGPSPQDYLIFQRLFFFNDHQGALAMLAGLALACFIPGAAGSVQALAEAMARRPVLVAASAFVALAAGSRFVYLAHPLSMDEYAPVLQARAFAAGSLQAYFPPEWIDRIVKPSFQGNFLLVDRSTGAVASAYWPGSALLMAPWAAVGLEWCLMPALSALALLLIHRIAIDISGLPSAGGWAMLAALASPQFTVNALSLYAMPALLALNLLFVWLAWRGSSRFAFAAGLVGGLALVMHNPVPHALFAMPVIAYLLWTRERRAQVPALLLGYVPIGLLLGLGWPALNASEGLSYAAPVVSESGFARTWWAKLGSVLTPPSPGLILVRVQASMKFWIWACPGLLLLALPGSRRPMGKVLLLALLLTYVFYFFVRFDQGHGWGYRYLHPAWGVLPILAGTFLAGARPAVRHFGTSVILAGVLATPVFLWTTHRTIADALAERPPSGSTGRWFVFVADQPRLYSGDLVQNDPRDDRVRIFLSEGRAADRAWVERYAPGASLHWEGRVGSSWRLDPAAAPPAAGSSGTR